MEHGRVQGSAAHLVAVHGIELEEGFDLLRYLSNLISGRQGKENVRACDTVKKALFTCSIVEISPKGLASKAMHSSNLKTLTVG